MKKPEVYRLAAVRVFARLSLSLLGTVLLLFLAVSCGDNSSPVGPDGGGDGDCINYEDYLHIVGSCDTPSEAYGVAVSGDYAYVADVYSGLQVIDIGTPGSPEIVGSIDTPGYAWGVAVSGDYAYVADYSSGLQVIDISTPGSPVIVGSIDTPGRARGVAVSGDYA